MKLLRFLLSFILVALSIFVKGQIYHRTDTLYIPETKMIPIIDGFVDENIWELTDWNSIDQIWMPYNNDQNNLGQEEGLELWGGANDFSGKYKVRWSSETNLLYFLIVIDDDIFTDGYKYNENPSSGGGYPNYDVVEVFIDENRSGGLHVFDGSGSVGNQWGINAENAFSYHLVTNEPEHENVETQFYALDIAGTNWGFPNQRIADYYSHFDEFSIRKQGNQYIWEFSLIVHSDEYNPSKQELSVVDLYINKIMGLSLGYCDNDTPSETQLTRDHFFGSVSVPINSYNDHWKQADWFGVAKLIESQTTFLSDSYLKEKTMIKSYVSNQKLYTSVTSYNNDPVNIRIFNIIGNEVYIKSANKSFLEWKDDLDLINWQSDIYIVEITHANIRKTNKIIVH